jgi:hypothetical protein
VESMWSIGGVLVEYKWTIGGVQVVEYRWSIDGVQVECRWSIGGVYIYSLENWFYKLSDPLKYTYWKFSSVGNLIFSPPIIISGYLWIYKLI